MTKKERLVSELMKIGALQVACALESDLAYYNDSDTFTKEFILGRVTDILEEYGYLEKKDEQNVE